jgi:predicted RNase H-like HicB family nuclease
VDGAFVGQCPGVIGPCCHGPDEVEVHRELCEIVEEWLDIARRDGTPLPPPTAGTGVALQDRMSERGDVPPAPRLDRDPPL